MIELTKAELRALYTILPEGYALKDKLRTMLAERAGELEWGECVFRVTFSLEESPTLNRYGSMKPWMQAKLRKVVDLRLMAEFMAWPKCRLAVPCKRGVAVTRHSSAAPDEIGIDVIGGKIAVDRLVQAGILGGDTAKHVERRAAWKPAPPGKGSLVVEVFELHA